MCRRYSAAAVLDKLKYLREVNFFEGAPALAAQNPRDKWEEMESEIRSHYTAAELKSMRRYGFSGKSVEARAEAIGLKSLYDNCYRIASRNVHMFDPAETAVTRGIFRGRAHSRRELLRLRREQLESTQNLLLGRLSFGMSEVMKDHLMSAELILIGLGYEKFRDRSSSPARQPDVAQRADNAFTVWRD